MRHRIDARVLLLVAAVLGLSSCGGGAPKSVPQDGSVTFSAEGQTFSFSEMQLEVQPNRTSGPAAAAAHTEATPIKRGKTDFGFRICATQQRALREYKAFNDYLKSGQAQRPDFPGLDFAWWQETEDPFVYFRAGKISVQRDPIWDVKETEAHEAFSSRGGGEAQTSSTDLWIQFDETTESRVKGRFGGTVFVTPLPPVYPPQERSVPFEGRFDLPVVKLYKYD